MYHYLKEKGLPRSGILAVMGNCADESAFRPDNVEDRCPISDESYTAAVDNGSYSREQFLRDGGKAYGYGLFQWTYWSRKAGLYDLAKKRGVSIASRQLQMDWLWEELQQGEYAHVLNKLMGDDSLFEKTKYFMIHFEKPADQSDSHARHRTRLAEEIGKELEETPSVADGDSLPSGAQALEKGAEISDAPLSAYWPPRCLCLDMSGADVAVLQALLVAHDYAVTITGVYDKTTRVKVMAYQAEHNLEPDGIAGPLTFGSLGVRA